MGVRVRVKLEAAEHVRVRGVRVRGEGRWGRPGM